MNVGDISQTAKDAIQQIYNNAGVNIDFVNGSADMTAMDMVSLPGGAGTVGQDFGSLALYSWRKEQRRITGISTVKRH